MYSSADYSITPRPMYPADGRKVFDIYTWPYSIRDGDQTGPRRVSVPGVLGTGGRRELAARRGRRRVALDRRIGQVDREQSTRPTLNLIYLPHLDYNLQRLGPMPSPHSSAVPRDQSRDHRDLRQIDAIVGDLIDFFQKRSVQVAAAFRIRHHERGHADSSEPAASASKAGSRSRRNSGWNCSIAARARCSPWRIIRSRTFI